MNKDLDERLVPNGEYRDALNVQVAASEGSDTTGSPTDIGTIQSILGNKEISGQSFINTNNSFCVGSVSDEKNNALYWLIAENTFEAAFTDANNTTIGVANPYIGYSSATQSHNVQGNGFSTALSTNYTNQDTLDTTSYPIVTKNIIAQYKDNVITPVFVDMAAKIFTMADAGGGTTIEQLLDDIDGGNYIAGTGAAVNTPQGYDKASGWPDATDNTLYNSVMLYDITNIKIGDKIKGIGLHPTTNEPFNFFPKNAVVTSVRGLGIWTDVDGKLRNHGIIYSNVDLYVDDWQSTLLEMSHYVNHISIESNVLNFNPNRLITGVNIIDDMLFWTDNFSEPKKINIPRSIEGTDSTGLIHTKVINKSRNINTINNVTDAREEHISVVKKAPTVAPTLKYVYSRDYESNDSYSFRIAVTSTTGLSFGDPDEDDIAGITQADGTVVSDPTDFTSLSVGDTLNIRLPFSLDGGAGFSVGLKKYDKVAFKEYFNNVAPAIPLSNYTILGEVKDVLSATTNPNNQSAAATQTYQQWTAGYAQVVIKIERINGVPPTAPNPLFYAVDLWDSDIESKFEFKFPRFATRYNYEDGENSPISPFTNVAFSPGGFEYDPVKGFNTAMINRVKEIVLKDFILSDIQEDVVSIDLLYKEEDNNSIYIIETIKPNVPSAINQFWNNNRYVLTDTTIKSILESNQILRRFDSVPKKALAQEIVGNRIVYGNYTQNFDTSVLNSDEPFEPIFDVSLDPSRTGEIANKTSIKSLREYQVGVAFVDKYGRETSVFSNKTGVISVKKNQSINQNQLKIGLKNNQIPEDLMYFKFFIKETAGEYHNAAMGRWYNAEDDNIWLAFPSSERNKMDIDTFLILKKAADANVLVPEKARYNILAIENEAPDFIKEDYQILGTIKEQTTSVFTEHPLYNQDTFIYKSTGVANTAIKDIHLTTRNERFEMYMDLYDPSTQKASGKYRITRIDKTGNDFAVQLEEKLGTDVGIFSNDPSNSQGATAVNSDTIVRFYKKVVLNKPEFDGRFFVKIYSDSLLKSYMQSQAATSDTEYAVVASRKIYHMFDLDDTLQGSFGDSNDANGARAALNPTNMAADYQFVSDPNVASSLYGCGGNATYVFGNITGADYCWRSYINYTTDYIASVGYSQTQPTNVTWPAAGTSSTVGALWKPFDSFLRGLNVADWDEPGGSHGLARRKQIGQSLDLKDLSANGDANNDDFEDVWFIDDGPVVGTFSISEPDPPSVADGTGWDTSPNVNPNMNGGITTYTTTPTARFEISFGGIQPIEQTPSPYAYRGNWKLTSSQPSTSDGQDVAFYSLNSLNTRYNNREKEFVDLLNTFGSQFRFKEDPNGTIYTISDSLEHFYQARFENEQAYVSNAWGNANNASTGAVVNSDHTRFKSEGYYRPSNFTRKWKFFTDKPVNWNPAKKDYSSIDAGNNTCSLTTDSGTGANKIFIKASDGITDTTTGISLQVGMVLSSTIISGVAHTLNTASKHPYAVVEKIFHNTVSSQFEITLGRYRMTSSNPAFTYNVDASTNATIGTLGKGVFMNLNGTSGTGFTATDTATFEWFAMNGLSPNAAKNINYFANNFGNLGGIAPVGYTMEFVQPIQQESILSRNPAIWETEPKESTDLDIYYEASGLYPIQTDSKSFQLMFPKDSLLMGHKSFSKQRTHGGFGFNNVSYTIVANPGIENNRIDTNQTFCADDGTGATQTCPTNLNMIGLVDDPTGEAFVSVGDSIGIQKEDGSVIYTTVTALGPVDAFNNCSILYIDTNLLQADYSLNWYNCFSFGNGVESNRVRDYFNKTFITNGPKASTTLLEIKGEEHRKNGLIYSGIYNSNSSVNNLNQFIAAEKITKDVNPEYGSIQKLHTRDSDLITLCEDKVLKILANKDALFNADGNTQLTATQNVLGQTIPFVGEHGISKNPESFASESYRTYFSDKQRGAILRLSKDGLTTISEYGMKDWFRDNLKLGDRIHGSYDAHNKEYNITLTNNNLDQSIEANQLGIYGCMDVAATNYNPLANVAINYTCNYPPTILGCTDDPATSTTDRYEADNSGNMQVVGVGPYNYDPNANTDDGSCCYYGGCFDPCAANNNASACFNVGGCHYGFNPYICNPIVNSYWDGTCYCGPNSTTVTFGDPNANNYGCTQGCGNSPGGQNQ